MENQGGDNSGNGNNWDLGAVLRFSGRGSMVPPTRTNNRVAQFVPLPPPQTTYPIAAFMEGLHKQEISALPQPQALQDLPHPHTAGWGPNQDQQLPLVYPTAIGNPVPVQPSLDQEPLMAPWLRNEAPAPSDQPPANKSQELKMAPSSRSDGVGPSTGPSKRRGTKRDLDQKVILVLADDPTPPDSWQWRKYGQKNIKDTPYNRSYYRCSTIKNCKARKHVQRCLIKPSFLTVTYLGEHSHPMPDARNSQAGSTRQKKTTTTTTTTPPLLPLRPFSNIPSTANQSRSQASQAPAPMSHPLPPFPKIPAAQEQHQTPAPPASVSPSLLPVPPPLRIQALQQPPQASATVPLAQSRSPLMSPTTLLRSPYAAIHSHPISPFCTCRTCITHQKMPVPVPQPPSPVMNMPSREGNQPQGPALVPLPYSLSPNNPMPLSPITEVLAMGEWRHTPALPVLAISALLSNNINRQLQPVSPLHRFQAVEQPTQIPSPVLTPPSMSSLIPPSMPLHSAPSLEVDKEDDDIDTDAIRVLLKDMEMMTPQEEEEEEEDPMLFLNLDEEPEDRDVLLSSTPEELPPFYTGAEQNMVYPMTYAPTPGAGSSGSKKNSQVFPVLDEAAAPSSSSNVSTQTGVGAGTAPVQTPTANVQRPPDTNSVSVFWEW